MVDTFHIQWHITNKCNLRCSHCYQGNFTSDDDLKISELNTIFENISSFLKNSNKKLIVDITGGEPFLYKDLNELAEKLYNSPYVENTGIITNGLFLEKHLKTIETFPELKLKISAEGVEKETYETFRGKNTFDIFIKNLKSINNFPNEKTLMFTILNTNYEEVKKLFDFSDNYNFSHFIMERFIPIGNGNKIKNQIISIKNWIKAIEVLLAKTGLDNDLYPLLPYRGFKISKEKGVYEMYGSPCITGKDGLSIMPDGSVFPCRRFNLSIGNLLKEDLTDIWLNSPVLKKIRNRDNLKGKCRTCNIEECMGCRALALALTDDYLEEDCMCFFNILKDSDYI